MAHLATRCLFARNIVWSAVSGPTEKHDSFIPLSAHTRTRAHYSHFFSISFYDSVLHLLLSIQSIQSIHRFHSPPFPAFLPSFHPTSSIYLCLLYLCSSLLPSVRTERDSKVSYLSLCSTQTEHRATEHRRTLYHQEQPFSSGTNLTILIPHEHSRDPSDCIKPIIIPSGAAKPTSTSQIRTCTPATTTSNKCAPGHNVIHIACSLQRFLHIQAHDLPPTPNNTSTPLATHAGTRTGTGTDDDAPLAATPAIVSTLWIHILFLLVLPKEQLSNVGSSVLSSVYAA